LHLHVSLTPPFRRSLFFLCRSEYLLVREHLFFFCAGPWDEGRPKASGSFFGPIRSPPAFPLYSPYRYIGEICSFTLFLLLQEEMSLTKPVPRDLPLFRVADCLVDSPLERGERRRLFFWLIGDLTC